MNNSDESEMPEKDLDKRDQALFDSWETIQCINVHKLDEFIFNPDVMIYVEEYDNMIYGIPAGDIDNYIYIQDEKCYLKISANMIMETMMGDILYNGISEELVRLCDNINPNQTLEEIQIAISIVKQPKIRLLFPNNKLVVIKEYITIH